MIEKKDEQRIDELWDNFKWSDIYLIGSPKSSKIILRNDNEKFKRHNENTAE